MPSVDGPLTCPRCSRSYPFEERFCPDCLMPLAYAGGAEYGPASAAERHARKIRPAHARGEPRRVAVGLNLAEAELIQGILLEQGIPSILRRSGGFDVPDFLAAGPRDVLVPESGVGAARELLADVRGEAVPDGAETDAPAGFAFRLAAGMLICLLVFGAITGLLWTLLY